jgi:hypothetical protein
MSAIHKFGFGFATLVVLFIFIAGQFYITLLSQENTQRPVHQRLPALHEKLSESFVLGASGITVQIGPLENFQD